MKSLFVSFGKILVATCILGVAASAYQLDTEFSGSSFFNGFTFFDIPDYTHGFVTYVNKATATSQGLIGTMANGSAYMGVDHTSALNATTGPGRSSVRITSNKAWTHGLVILDLAHMPGTDCGSWPAFWMVGPDWPAGGEIDIIEGVNSQTLNQISLHTNDNCTIAGNSSTETGYLINNNCAISQSTGCAVLVPTPNGYGTPFNTNNGGVYATEWTSSAIRVWYFPRNSIPADISSGLPNPSAWELPQVNMAGNCNIDQHFYQHQIIFDTTFCGDWAGNVWSSDAICKSKATSCEAYVAGNPEVFADAYWLVNYLKVYTSIPGPSSTSSSQRVSSTSLPVLISTSNAAGSSSKISGTTTSSTSIFITSTAPQSTLSSTSIIDTLSSTSSTLILSSSSSSQQLAAPTSTSTSVSMSTSSSSVLVAVPTSTYLALSIAVSNSSSPPNLAAPTSTSSSTTSQQTSTITALLSSTLTSMIPSSLVNSLPTYTSLSASSSQNSSGSKSTSANSMISLTLTSTIPSTKLSSTSNTAVFLSSTPITIKASTSTSVVIVATSKISSTSSTSLVKPSTSMVQSSKSSAPLSSPIFDTKSSSSVSRASSITASSFSQMSTSSKSVSSTTVPSKATTSTAKSSTSIISRLSSLTSTSNSISTTSLTRSISTQTSSTLSTSSTRSSTTAQESSISSKSSSSSAKSSIIFVSTSTSPRLSSSTKLSSSPSRSSTSSTLSRLSSSSSRPTSSTAAVPAIRPKKPHPFLMNRGVVLNENATLLASESPSVIPIRPNGPVLATNVVSLASQEMSNVKLGTATASSKISASAMGGGAVVGVSSTNTGTSSGSGSGSRVNTSAIGNVTQSTSIITLIPTSSKSGAGRAGMLDGSVLGIEMICTILLVLGMMAVT